MRRPCLVVARAGQGKQITYGVLQREDFISARLKIWERKGGRITSIHVVRMKEKCFLHGSMLFGSQAARVQCCAKDYLVDAINGSASSISLV